MGYNWTSIQMKNKIFTLLLLLLTASFCYAQDQEILISESFSSYNVGSKIAVAANNVGNYWWTTWSNAPGSSEDGVVANFDNTKCGHLTYGNDQVLLLGDEENGNYDLEFDILIPEGKNGYFNILHHIAGFNSTWAMQCYLHLTNDGSNSTPAPGHGTVHAGSNSTCDLPCVYDEWMHFRVHVDADNDVAQLYFNVVGQPEEMYAEWQWSLDSFGNNVVDRTLGAMDFLPMESAFSSEYYLDNFNFSRIGGNTAPILTVTPNSIDRTLQGGQMVSVPITINNTGNSIGDWAGWLDFGQGGAGSQTADLYYHNGDVSTASSIGSPYAYTCEFGIRLPATAYAGAAMGMRITSAKFYVTTYTATDYNYIFRIYGQGLHNQPGELLAEKTINTTATEQWITATFDEPVYMTGQTMWATIQLEQTAGEYPMTMDGGEYGEEQDGNWLSTNGNNFNHCYSAGSFGGAWMITVNCEGNQVPTTWASINKTEGSIIANTSETITLSLNSIGITQGTYNTNFIVETNDANMTHVEIPVVLHVNQSSNYYIIDATSNPTDGGTVSGAGTYAQGTICTLSASANSGYSFVKWTKNGTQISTNPTYSFAVTGNESYVANFEPTIQYTITADVNPSNSGIVSGAGTYAQGTICTLSASANSDYSFVEWTKNGSTVSTIPTYSFTVAESATYVANFLSIWDGTWEPWTHGTGTEADPFLIENAQQLAYLAYRVNNGLDAGGGHVSNHNYHYKLMVDIDLNGSENFQWNPIGYWNSDTDYQCFGGHFDGNGHVMSGLYINSSANRVGFFGNVKWATIENLGIIGETIATTSIYAGGVIGVADVTSVITNCYNTGTVSSSTSYSCSGGIVGYAVGTAYITNCYNTGTVSSPSFSSYGHSGGIVGHAAGTIYITNCYNTGAVSSSSYTSAYAGGIIGYANTSTITNCYNIGAVSGYNRGGIVGRKSNGTVTNSYYLNTCGGNNTYGGQPMSADAMQTQEFVETLNNGLCAWEYDSNNTNSGYPVLTMIQITVTTSDATEITQTHATLHGTIEVENTSIISRGFEYKKTTDSNYQTITVSGSGEISHIIPNLLPNTQYQYRTFCGTNDACGMTYGEEKTFTTLPISVTTNNASEITQTHATLNGNINFGDANISSQGFQYKRTTDSEYQTIEVSGSGSISTTLSDLTPNTQYRFRAFCTLQDGGPVYGQLLTFNTLAINVTTNNATDITQTHATLNGNINVGDANITSQGFEYKKTSDSEYQTIIVSGGGSISTTLPDLTPNTQYRFRAFCIMQDGDPVYGELLTFNTLTINVTTYSASNVTESSATLNGNIDAGDAVVSDKGFKYWPTNNPQNVSTVSVSTTGNISATINNLAQNTYQYRAFAESDGDIYQGGIKEFEISWLNSDTILVYDANKLHWVAEQCNSGVTFEGKCVKLMNDIELPFNVPNNMISIGSYPDRPFKGTFDGNGKHITNLYIDQPNTPYQGFFGYTLNANLYNVGLVNITASGRNYTGGMVAYAKNTHMRECYVNGGTLYALSYCGGLVGYQEQGTNSIISGCYNTCEVRGNNYVGGLIGFSNYSTVRNSYVAGRVSAQGEPVGAIIGGANEVLMYYCYFSIDITGQTNAIGENNFKDGEGLTNEQMRDPQFVSTLNQGLVTPVWKADYEIPINNGFPIIMWQEGSTTGIEEDYAAMDYISLYPNPAKDFVTIQSNEPNISLKQVEVYDVMGRKVMSENLDGQSQGFSIEKLPAGIYNVRILTDNGCYTNLKLVVQ